MKRASARHRRRHKPHKRPRLHKRRSGQQRLQTIVAAHSTTRILTHGFAVPPAPPLKLDAQVAMDPHTDDDVLWHIAQHAPELRYWLVANPSASAELLEYVAQAGGPNVEHAFAVLFDALDDDAE